MVPYSDLDMLEKQTIFIEGTSRSLKDDLIDKVDLITPVYLTE